MVAAPASLVGRRRRRLDFPASALITVAGLARAEMLVEVQGCSASRLLELVDINETPIERITPTDIKTADREYAFDIIIYATGV